MAYKNRVLDQLVSMCAKFCGEDEIIRLGRLSEDYQQDGKLQACLMSQKIKRFPKGPTDSALHNRYCLTAMHAQMCFVSIFVTLEFYVVYIIGHLVLQACGRIGKTLSC